MIVFIVATTRVFKDNDDVENRRQAFGISDTQPLIESRIQLCYVLLTCSVSS